MRTTQATARWLTPPPAEWHCTTCRRRQPRGYHDRRCSCEYECPRHHHSLFVCFRHAVTYLAAAQSALPVFTPDPHLAHWCHHEGCRPPDSSYFDVCTDECARQVKEPDLVVYSRVGERRIIPLSIENRRGYRRAIRIEISEWASWRGDQGIAISSALDRAELEVSACSEELITLEIVSSVAEGESEQRVDFGCAVYCAHLLFAGCDRRPVRIALVLLSNSSRASRISCDPHCC